MERPGRRAILSLIRKPGLLFYKIHSLVHLADRLREFRRALDFIAGRGVHNPRVIDVGCGLGEACVVSHEKGFSYTGIEVDRGCVEYCRNRYRGFGNAVFLEGAAEDLPLETGGGDVVLLNGVVHHLSDQQLAKLFDAIGSSFGVIILDHVLQPQTNTAVKYMQNFIQRKDKGKFIRPLSAFDSIGGRSNVYVYSREFTINVLGFPLWPYFCRAYLMSDRPEND